MIKNLILAIVLTVVLVIFNYMLDNLENVWIYAISFFCASFLGFTISDIIKQKKRKS